MKELARAIDACLARVREGEKIESCLAEYPHIRQHLKPLLETALSVSSAPKAAPSDEFRRLSTARIMSKMRESRAQAEAARTREPVRMPGWIGSLGGVVAGVVAQPRRAAVPATAGLFIALAALLLTYSISSLFSYDTALASQCTLSLLSGSAQVQLPGSDQWMVASDGLVVEEGTRVKTTSDSHALLTFFEGSTIGLEPGTDICVERVGNAEEQGTEIVLRQWVGKTWNRVVKKMDPGSRYEIRTPSAYALVRGTLFETEVDDAGFTTVRTIEGMVSVLAVEEEVYVPAGYEVSVEPGAAPSSLQPTAPAESELIVTVSMPAVASVVSPDGASTGYLPNGVYFNQIPGSTTSNPCDGDQVIRIAWPTKGIYHLILRGVGDGTSNVTLQYVSDGEELFSLEAAYEITSGVQSELAVLVESSGGDVVQAYLFSDLAPLEDRVLEKIVTPPASLDYYKAIVPPEATGEPAGTGDDIHSGGGNHNVTSRTCTLSVICVGKGQVLQPGQGIFVYDRGTEVDLVARASPGWEFVSWTGGVADPTSLVTTMKVDQPSWVTANFVLSK
jgi:hypothetical protein